MTGLTSPARPPRRPTGPHRRGCGYRLAAECAVGIACSHGRDVCPTCDPCDCGVGGESYGFHRAAPGEVPDKGSAGERLAKLAAKAAP